LLTIPSVLVFNTTDDQATDTV